MARIDACPLYWHFLFNPPIWQVVPPQQSESLAQNEPAGLQHLSAVHSIGRAGAEGSSQQPPVLHPDMPSATQAPAPVPLVPALVPAPVPLVPLVPLVPPSVAGVGEEEELQAPTAPRMKKDHNHRVRMSGPYHGRRRLP